MQFINWLVTSSADPNKYSATVKGTLVTALPFVVQALQFSCGFHLVCFAVDNNLLAQIPDAVANLVYLIIALFGAGWTLFGIGRKLWLGRWATPAPTSTNTAPLDLQG